MSKKFLYIIIIMGLLLGCGNRDEQGKIEALLQEDPLFQKVLAKKEKLDLRLKQLKAQLSQEEKLFRSKVSALRDEHNSKKIQIKQQIDQLALELEPERHQINLMIAQKSQDLKFNLETLKGLKGMRKNVSKLLGGKKHLKLPGAERSRWQEKLTHLEGRIKDLTHQISKVRGNLRQLKIKKALLKQ